MGCGKTQEYLANANLEAAELQSATKSRIERDEAIQLARSSRYIYAAKGKKVVTVDLKKDHLDDDELGRLILGPTGNLRAPTLRVGNKLLVGFNQETYDQLLG